ncbi:MAG: hypothetical protein WCF27_09715 [Gaiellaceae bacterium]
MRFSVVSVSLALLAAGAAHAAPSQSGLRGVVMRGPITPVCVADMPCSEPAKNVTLVFSRAGHVAGRVVTDSHGLYRIHLPAGVYSVRRATSRGIDRKLDPNRVRVLARRFVRADFSIDTGIR